MNTRAVLFTGEVKNPMGLMDIPNAFYSYAQGSFLFMKKISEYTKKYSTSELPKSMATDTNYRKDTCGSKTR